LALFAPRVFALINAPQMEVQKIAALLMGKRRHDAALFAA
jgi:hypothetical protein